MSKGGCKYIVPWSGRCGEPVEEDSEYCEKHGEKDCILCGEQATHGCEITVLGLVCGFGVCDKSECKDQHKESHLNK